MPDEDNSNRQEHISGGRGGNTRLRNALHKFGLAVVRITAATMRITLVTDSKAELLLA
jgi:hypothetical protein